MEISEWWNKKIEELSKGMAQKVQFIVTVLHRPELLIFDEPFSGFDPINANILKREILRLRDEGATVIFSTHNMASVEELCDEISLINRSHNILSGRVADIRERFSGRRYELTYTGAPDALAAIPGVQLGAISPEGFATATIALPGADDVKAFLATANSAVDINGFRRIMPSMDDIFVAAVEASNAGSNNNDQPSTSQAE